MRRRLFLLTTLLLLCTTWLAQPGASAPLDYDNDTDGHLSNGGFEGNYYPVGLGQVAEGWTRLNLGGNPTWMSTQIFANGGWVERIGGENSQILSVEALGIGQPFETVLYQRVEGLTPGRSYSYSGWVLKLWGGSANTQLPEDPFSYGSWIGVDPTGGTNPNAATVTWGEPEWQDEIKGHFENHRLAVTATGSSMTVFVRLWLKWQRAETQAIVDALELYEAPQAILESASAYVSTPSATLHWRGVLPDSLRQRGNYQLFYQVQQQQADGSWLTLAKDLQDSTFAVELTEGESAILRVLPTSYQPKGQPGVWPPTTHIGLATAPVTLTLDTTAPTARLDALPQWSTLAPFLVRWAGSDQASGVRSFDVEYRAAGQSEWLGWLSASPATSASFGLEDFPQPLTAGDEWEFRVRARDAAGNVGAWSTPGQVGLATQLLRGQLLTIAGEPLPGARITVAPYPFSEEIAVDTFGRYEVPLAGAQSYTFSFLDAQGRRRLPDTTLPLSALSATRNWYLPPVTNAVTNGHFETTEGWSEGWQRRAGGASGAYAASITMGSILSQTVELNEGAYLSLSWGALTSDTRLRLELGEEQWELQWPGTVDAWHHVIHPITGEGTQTLTISGIGGAVLVDEVFIGTPDDAPIRLLLPLAR